jgi:hypothetical protein
VSLNDETCKITESTSAKYIKNKMGIKISTFSRTARNDSVPPMANDPVSPIKALAGYILYMRKPSKHPIIIKQKICTSALSETIKKKKYVGIATTPKRPSSPSVKLMAFAEPTTNNVMTKTYNNIESSKEILL